MTYRETPSTTIAKVARALDALDAESLRACWTDDARYSMTRASGEVGADETTAETITSFLMAASARQNGRLRHVATSISTEYSDGETASSQSLTLYVSTASADLLGLSECDDTLMLVDGRWKIKERHIRQVLAP